jgi:hypothetical protein
MKYSSGAAEDSAFADAEISAHDDEYIVLNKVRVGSVVDTKK